MKVNTVADLKRALTVGTPIVIVAHSLAEKLPRVKLLIGLQGVVASVHSYGIEINRGRSDGRTSRLDWPKAKELTGGDDTFIFQEYESSQRMALRIEYVFGEKARAS